ncbi:putative nucleic acid-binding, replication factor A [Helianthus annuus]|nr:putative nucleic acid-binding, replication factor A [Helianthus annuus]
MAVRNISDVNPNDNAAPLEVRVIRTWQPFLFQNEHCYLFVDSRGDAIEAYGNRRDKALFESKFSVGLCYRISKYLSKKARNSHNVVPSNATIHLGRSTVFEPIVGVDIPHQYFNFMPYESLRARENMHFLLTDYIGRFDRFTSDTRTTSGKRLMKFLLEDANERFIEVALWEEIADAVDKEALVNTPFPCIVAVTSMKVLRFKNLQLASTAATHLYGNPTIQDASDLANRFRERYAGINMDDRYTLPIANILAKNPVDYMEVKFSCIASIVSYNPRRSWFYKGCTVCKKKLGSREDALICDDHHDAPQPKYLYCINCTIADSTGNATVTIFDIPFQSVIKIPCNELVIQQGYTDSMTTPDVFSKLLGVSHMFKLQFNDRAHTGFTQFVANEVLEYVPVMNEVAVNEVVVNPTITEVSDPADVENQHATQSLENPPTNVALETTVKQVPFTPVTPAKIYTTKRQLFALSGEGSNKAPKTDAP